MSIYTFQVFISEEKVEITIHSWHITALWFTFSLQLVVFTPIWTGLFSKKHFVGLPEVQLSESLYTQSLYTRSKNHFEFSKFPSDVYLGLLCNKQQTGLFLVEFVAWVLREKLPRIPDKLVYTFWWSCCWGPYPPVAVGAQWLLKSDTYPLSIS